MNSLERIGKTFEQRKAFIAYLTAGDGGIQQTLAKALALIDGGVTMLEIGMPFSDPIADGPVIQRASARALASGARMQDILWLASEIRRRSEIPLILFSYLNPILAALKTAFLAEAKQAGIDGLLIVDCPIEEMRDLHQQCHQHQLAPIYVLSPTTPLQRIHKINRSARGFVYYACRKGTTGMRDDLPADFQAKIQLLKAHIKVPIVVGFGISKPAVVAEILQHADGVVIGSLFVRAIEQGQTTTALTALARSVYPN